LCTVCFNNEAPDLAQSETAITPPDAFAPDRRTTTATPLARITHEAEVTLLRHLPEFIDRALPDVPLRTRNSLRYVLDGVINSLAYHSRSVLPPSPYQHPVTNWHTAVTFDILLPDPSVANSSHGSATFTDDEARPTAE
jgi:hypothetical protein